MATQLVDDRELALSVGFTATDWTKPVTFMDYVSGLQDWSVKAVMRDGECIGAVYKKDDEVHTSILSAWRGKWATRGLLRDIFDGPVIKTQVTPGHEFMNGILARLGFKQENSKWVLKQS